MNHSYLIVEHLIYEERYGGGKRKKQGDFYETPRWAIEALLKREGFDGVILEPCCGKDAISKVLEVYGYKVKSSDIATEDNIYYYN